MARSPENTIGTEPLGIAFTAFGSETLVNTPAGQFIRKAQELIWNYSPDVKKEIVIPGKYEFLYIEPGIAQTPEVELYLPGGKRVSIQIEGSYPEGTDETRFNPSSLSLVVKNASGKSSLTIDFDPDGNPISESIPAEENILKGVRVQDWLISEYSRIGTPKTPDYHYRIDPMPCH
ncbi:MAG: hypothetical protein AABX29_01560 [Nanoarchaeota archaeon]